MPLLQQCVLRQGAIAYSVIDTRDQNVSVRSENLVMGICLSLLSVPSTGSCSDDLRAFEFKVETEHNPVKSHSSVPEIKQKIFTCPYSLLYSPFKSSGVLWARMNSRLLLS